MFDVKRRTIIATVSAVVLAVTLIVVTALTGVEAGPFEGLLPTTTVAEAGADDEAQPGEAQPGEAQPGAVEAVPEVPRKPDEFANARQAQAPAVAGACAQAPDAFDKVAPDSWALAAVKTMAADELPSLENQIDGQKPVSRYELAVMLARMLEKMQGSDGVIRGPIEKVATLEKLTREFGSELQMLGVRLTRFDARLGKLEGRVGALAGDVQVARREAGEALRRSQASERKMAQTAQQLEELVVRLGGYDEQLGQTERRFQKMGEVLSRVLVKVALADTRAPEAGGDRRELTSMAQTVQGLQDKVALLESGAKDTKPTRAVQLSVQERQQLRVLGDAVAGLRDKLDKTESQVSSLKAGGAGAVSPEALAEVKGLLKGFLGTFERRLNTVERKML